MQVNSTTTTTTTSIHTEAWLTVGCGGGGFISEAEAPGTEAGAEGGHSWNSIPSFASPPQAKHRIPFTQAERKEYGENKKALRFMLHDIAGKLLPNERVAECFRKVVPDPRDEYHREFKTVDTYYSEHSNKCHERNLFKCGSVWVCPVCGYRVSEKRKEELVSAFTLLQGAGYSFAHAVFTVQHHREDDTRDTLNLLLDTYSKMTRGKAYKKFKEKYQIVGFVRALEFTYSHENGGHPHSHLVIISKLPQDELDSHLGEMLAYYDKHFTRKLEAAGKLTYKDTVKVDPVHDPGELADYCTKWAIQDELVKGTDKQGKLPDHLNPFQMLDMIRKGDSSYKDPFIDYAFAFRGRKQLHKSENYHVVDGKQVPDDKFLHDCLFPPDKPEKTDEELAQEIEDPESELALQITASFHETAIAKHGRFYIVRKHQLVTWAFTTRNLEELTKYLTEEIGIPSSQITYSEKLLRRCGKR